MGMVEASLVNLQIQQQTLGMSDIIIGVERTLTDLAKWNKKRVRWVITHNAQTFTRQHVIDLEMVIVSSERVIKVDDEFKHKSMISFGFSQEFEISSRLKGKIVQDGLTFELYVNGLSFTDLSKKQYVYEPPKLETDFYQPKAEQKTIVNSIKPNNNPYVFKVQPKHETVPSPVIPKRPSSFTITQPPKTEDALKSAQDELMKIMIEQKRKRKQLQNQKGSK